MLLSRASFVNEINMSRPLVVVTFRICIYFFFFSRHSKGKLMKTFHAELDLEREEDDDEAFT